MDFEKLSEEELLRKYYQTLSAHERNELIGVIVRKVLWQDIAIRGPNYKALAINVCRHQDGLGLKEAAYLVDVEYHKK